MTKAEEAAHYGTLHYDHEEEWLVVSLSVGDLNSKGALEHTVVHEMAHALFSFGALSDTALETFCNRLAKLLTRKRGPRRRSWTQVAEKKRAKKMAPRLEKLLDLLPPDEREVMELLLWDEASLEQVVDALGISNRTVRRRRDNAYRRLGKVLVEGVMR